MFVRSSRAVLVAAVLLVMLGLPTGAQAFINDVRNLPQAQDTNPDLRVFETTLTARQGSANIVNPSCLLASCRVTNAITFNGIIGGPEIRVRVGDRLIVHYASQLPASAGRTSIHWHGIELDNSADGTAVTQQPIGNGQSITYDFVVPRPGIYWFHGHMSPSNPTLKGQYAPLIVTGPDDEKLQSVLAMPPGSRTKTLMLSDMTVCKAPGSNDDATFPAGSSVPWAGDTNGDGSRDPFPGKRIGPSPRALCEHPIDNSGNAAAGPLADRTIPNVQYKPMVCNLLKLVDLSTPCTVNEGQNVLVNGRIPAPRGGSPDGGTGPADVADSVDVLRVRPGDGFRLQMVNAADARYFRLQLAGSGGLIPLIRIGGEGGLLNSSRIEGGLNANPKYLTTNGLNSAGNPQYTRGEILLAPGQRADVVFQIPMSAQAGDVITLWTRDFQRGIGNDGPNPLEKAPTGPCAAGPGRCGPNGYSLVPTAPVLHMKVFVDGGFATWPVIREAAPLRTDSRVNMPLEDLRSRTPSALLTPAQVGQTRGSSDSRVILQMGTTKVVNGVVTGDTPLPAVNNELGMLDDNHDSVPISSIPRPNSTRYVRLGEIVQLAIRNTSGMNHPFHLHGASFQPVRLQANPDCSGDIPPTWRTFEYPEFVDTFDVPACTQLILKVRYDDRPQPDIGVKAGGGVGRWVFHCHIFEHAADGMMSEVDVVPPAGPTLFRLRTTGLRAAGATVVAVLRKRRTVVLRVARLVTRKRRTDRVTVGVVRLGSLPAGRSVRHWNLRVKGRVLRPGRYEVTMHAALGNGLLSLPAKPGARTLTVLANGRVR